MSNLELYDKLRVVPDNAKKTIGAGRLKGFTDINPMWRIKSLTELFGQVGVGWYYKITDKWIENGADGSVCAFVMIDLFVKVDGQWSEPIQGIGGSGLVQKETNGLYTSDECFKMALTDAISISCKALGMGADVYFEKDRTKYDAPHDFPKTIDTPEQVKDFSKNKSQWETTSTDNSADTFQFGKYKGKTIQEVIVKDIAYCQWAYENGKDGAFKDRIKELLDLEEQNATPFEVGDES